MPYAFGVDHNGEPDAEARVRLDDALAIAMSKIRDFDIMIFLGAGMSERTKPYGAESLAASAAAYLQKKGWLAKCIVTRPMGYSTLTETCALYDYIKQCSCPREDMVIEVVSSWWHIPRVWTVCRIMFGSSVKVRISQTGHSGKTLLYDILREIPALPRSALMAWALQKKCV